MTDIILSVYPRFADLILEGKKTVEVRKTRISQWNGYFGFKYDVPNTVYLYATSPVKKIVGECKCNDHFYSVNIGYSVNPDIPESLTEALSCACLTNDEYYRYVGDEGRAYFYMMRDPLRYETPKELSEFGLSRAPQSFCYINEPERPPVYKDRSLIKIRRALNQAKCKVAQHELKKLIDSGCIYQEGTDARVPGSDVYGQFWWPYVRNAVLKRDDHTCKMCGCAHELEVHHIMHRQHGGSDHPYNLITLCRHCHDRVHSHIKMDSGKKITRLDLWTEEEAIS